MNKSLTPWLLIILALMSGCADEELSGQAYMNTHTHMLKLFCEQRSACLDRLEQQAVECRHLLDGFDSPQMTDQEIVVSGGQYMMCIMEKMDAPFMARFNQAFPVQQREVKITRPSRDMNQPGVLYVVEKQGQIYIQDQIVAEKDIRQYIFDHQLTVRYEKVALVFTGEPDAGLMIGVGDQLKKAGFSQVSLVVQ